MEGAMGLGWAGHLSKNSKKNLDVIAACEGEEHRSFAIRVS